MDPTLVTPIRPRVRPTRGKVHLTPGGYGGGLTLCNIPCDGWAVTDADPDCKRCIVADELNRLRDEVPDEPDRDDHGRPADAPGA